ncbi:flagellar hook-associated protein FlgK [Massilia eurypsychrophila]|jgi:flagellar hook-associated protein 1 FlgK|uniref:Flagellar hook-associated protein 1 n=1 Tax=Massilia eurypsychrophila TaxID=1485217 RepID=A0A2G8TBC2_9BURK|nr:flagellar hook-associated protein FlgK [Massilia eurypsychrophila]PIL43357.1 flagellar hook-associated protein FlgK [Massilia eurypsychrophila]
MAGNLLSIGKTGLFAAQAGLATTGHNIANAHVPGYSRQQTVQTTMTAQDAGYGFVGSGTQVADIKRYSDEFLNVQVRNAQSTTSALASYNAQITQVDNLLANTTSGLSPALQDFFKSVQSLSANAASTPSRQNFLSSAETLAARFQGINGQLEEMRSGVNSQITSNVTLINSYATQIATLNDQISSLSNSTGHAPNDLLDQRDQIVLDLNKQIKATAMRGDNNTITVSIGSGQPLVVGNKSFELAVTPAPGDRSRLEVGYVTGTRVTQLSAASLGGGELGGLLDFRSTTLDHAQNAIGRVAIGMAVSFNAQHRMGQDSAGNLGGDLFKVAPASVSANMNSAPPDSPPSDVTAQVIDPSMLTTSDYMVEWNDSEAAYTITRLSDRDVTIVPYSPSGAHVGSKDGISFTITGKEVSGDAFLVRPTINGAAQFAVVPRQVGDIAAASPVIIGPLPASPPGWTGNKGNAVVSDGSVNGNFLPPNPAFAPVTIKYNAATNELSGFVNNQTVEVTVAGVKTQYTAGTAPVIPFVAGASYEFGGVTMTMRGLPVDGDQFTVKRNSGGVGDNRNMVLMGELASKPLLDKGTATYQAGFAQLVSSVGNKAREVQVNGLASESMLARANAVQQSVSGVNLDEEAANLLKYQQAYQAAGKVMQIASTMFDTLLSLGR